MLNKKQTAQYICLVALWTFVNVLFWAWWLTPEHIGNLVLFSLISLAFFYDITILPSFYLFYLGNMKKPQKMPAKAAVKAGIVKNVAMITTTVPGSESLDIVRKQLVALKKVKFPHDSWVVVDKEHSPDIQKMANSLGVKYFSRKDVSTWGQKLVKKWNQDIPPFKAKTKAGNVNAWIDAFGSVYSHFTQLDIDHIPNPNYLDEVLGYFRDDNVAWVQAPSVYGNLKDWTARGSAEQELVLQGPMQMGFYGFCKTPFIIGSHSTYDMAAIKNIGGFQPTRAEDHLDTVFLAANGKQGVYVPKVIAVGDGPENFETYLAQQFAWAFSMIQVLINYTPKCIKKYTFKQAIQFLFVQSWYTFYSTSLLILFILPVISLFTNTPISNVSYISFMLMSLPIAIMAFVIWIWSHKWHSPKNVFLSWRGIILHIARWPTVLSAFIQVILKIEKPYMITTKGINKGQNSPFSILQHSHYLLLILLSLISCWYYLLVFHKSSIQGYLLFALQGSLMFALVFFTALIKDMLDMQKDGTSLLKAVLVRTKPLIVSVLLLVLLVGTAFVSEPNVKEAILYKDTLRMPIKYVQNKMAIPSVTADAQSDLVVKYTVKDGDTLWSISQEFYGDGSAWEKIAETNMLSGVKVKPGQELIIYKEPNSSL
ncbi:MAG TPA: glycosyltransferase family 2 protein [Candidatus Saccharimonadales bacterium]|nr:glycosyltransferase family 2 protein [Candidatus Saccharimonadales bacterium]